ncbi:GntR family transcriptional regulator [Homoserinimonas aerilata]|uniref:GntR family transcriptional regulator n=1 Tax=Homoserinimonas aerilata TaxID=1162970 RepID=A0A542YAG4_9MICO|nr:GntR family transcriptional regulator [Homoserinimonas aerilata]TQL45075.1 GntR family transcriptional regulator [Homoserinimonas aerilata]
MNIDLAPGVAAGLAPELVTGRRVSSTDLIHEKLRTGIVSGELAAGSRHSIYQLAERFGVSRTPVRDAVLRLADAGMLTIERNRGVVIRGLGVEEIRSVFELRLLLEVPAAAAAARAHPPALLAALGGCLAGLDEAAAASDSLAFSAHDRRLHRLILEASGNARLVDMVESLRDSTQVRGVSTMQRSRSLRQVEGEHVPIVEAIREGDADAAARLMREHLVETGRLLMRQVAASSGEAVPQEWPPALVAP